VLAEGSEPPKRLMPRALMFKFAQCQQGHPGTTIDEQRWQMTRRIRRPADASSGPAVLAKARKKG
jgi:hypothetical protein